MVACSNRCTMHACQANPRRALRQTEPVRGGVKVWSHVVVGASVAIVVALAALGLIGENRYEEKIEQLQVVVSGAGASGVRITETIDHDFGSEPDRHGPQLEIPNDFGIPQDITAESPDAPDAVADVSPTVMADGTSATRIRVGDPDVVVSGQHRYTISYVLPTARFARPDFSLDAVGAASAIAIEDVTVVLSGISLDQPRCTVGAAGSDTECPFDDTSPLRVEVERLDPFEGITISGEVTSWNGGDPVPAPPLPERRTSDRGLATAGAAALGLVTAGGIFVWARQRGVNEVVGSSPSDAAYGAAVAGPGSTRTVSDAALAEMTTIEFAPPKGIEPWQGAVVLTERLDQSTVTAWFSGAIADDVLAIELRGNRPRLSRGPRAGEADAVTLEILRKLFANREVVDLDGFDANFARAWTMVEERQDVWVQTSGWWRSKPPRRNVPRGGGCLASVALLASLVALGFVGSLLSGLLGSVGGIVSLLVVAVGVTGLTARVAYAPLLAGRTANGSAYALQVESFRRFLVESEGQHVEWAWQNGLLRQYSAWAVALDAADAWQHAMERAGVPPAEVQASATPLLVHQTASSFHSSHVEPASSGSSGGGSSSSSSGGGSSGSVGGGGGGGSHGSW